jgi:amino-acid N-acetyltransferase
MSDLSFRFATPENEKEIRQLLASAGLPDKDVGPHLANFIVVRNGENIAGCIGLERAGNDALLRSLAVLPDLRSKGIGAELCRRITERAQQLGYRALYLLTETAEEYFSKIGYQKIDRTEAPDGIQQTEEFRTLCPDSSILMKINL